MDKITITCPECKAEVEYKKAMRCCPACNTVRIFLAFPIEEKPASPDGMTASMKAYLDDVGSISEYINRSFEEIER